jgi:site-specific recombinase XerD
MSDEYREELNTRLTNIMVPYVNEITLSDIRMKIQIALAEYDVEKRNTELAIYTEGKNEAMIKRYIASKLAAGRSTRTLTYYKNTLVFFFSRVGKDFDDITADDIRLYLAVRMNKDQISKTTANNERRNLSAFYQWLQVEEVLLKNPMNKVPNIKQTKKKKKAFSDMDIELIRAHCKTERETALVETLLSTWCRVSELTGIRLDDINDNEILVHGKGDKDRLVYLNAKAKLAIERYLQQRSDDNPYLFPKAKYAGRVDLISRGRRKAAQPYWYKEKEFVDKDQPMAACAVESIIREIGRRAGVENTHPHRFRRTGATHALQSGMALITVSKLLGHSGLDVTQIYLDISDEELMQAHNKYVK